MKDTPTNYTLADVMHELLSFKAQVNTGFIEVGTALKELKGTVTVMQQDIRSLRDDVNAIFVRIDHLEQEVQINRHYYQGARTALTTAGKAFVNL